LGGIITLLKTTETVTSYPLNLPKTQETRKTPADWSVRKRRHSGPACSLASVDQSNIF